MGFLARFACVLGVIASLVVFASPAYSAQRLTDAQAKVLIMLNFINKYVAWPGSFNLQQTGFVNVCAFGNDAVTQELPILQQASSGALKVNVYLNQQEKFLSRCHVVYIANSAHSKVEQVFALVKDAPVLTVSAAPRFIDQGGMVGLTEHVERQGTFAKTFVRYEVNRDGFGRAGLRIDPDAMELATRVIQ